MDSESISILFPERIFCVLHQTIHIIPKCGLYNCLLFMLIGSIFAKLYLETRHWGVNIMQTRNDFICHHFQYSLWPLLEFMKHGSPIWNWIPLYSDEQQDQFQTRTFKCLFLQITVKIGGKMVRLREDSFSILIKQDA